MQYGISDCPPIWVQNLDVNYVCLNIPRVNTHGILPRGVGRGGGGVISEISRCIVFGGALDDRNILSFPTMEVHSVKVGIHNAKYVNMNKYR